MQNALSFWMQNLEFPAMHLKQSYKCWWLIDAFATPVRLWRLFMKSRTLDRLWKGFCSTQKTCFTCGLCGSGWEQPVWGLPKKGRRKVWEVGFICKPKRLICKWTFKILLVITFILRKEKLCQQDWEAQITFLGRHWPSLRSRFDLSEPIWAWHASGY